MELETAFRLAIRSTGRRRLTVAEIVQEYSTEQLAPTLAGTENRRSKAYRTASRNLQRYRRTGRMPTGARFERLAGYAKRVVIRGANQVHFEGWVLVSKDERFRVIDAVIKALRWAGIRDLWDDGDHDAAIGEFEDAFTRAWGVPHAIITEVEVLTFRILQ